MLKTGWDHVALSAFRKMKDLPLPDDISAGESIVHRPTKEWYTYGDRVDESVIAIDKEGEPVILIASECYAAWNPKRDPVIYENLLYEERRRKK